MIHAVGLFEPNAFSRTFKPGTLIRPGNYILSRRGVACVNGAQNRLRNSVTVLGEFAGRSAVVICQKGAKLSEGAAARGCEGWRKAGLPLVTIFPPGCPCHRGSPESQSSRRHMCRVGIGVRAVLVKQSPRAAPAFIVSLSA